MVRRTSLALILFLAAAMGCHAGTDGWEAVWIGAPWEGEECVRDSVHAAPQFRKVCGVMADEDEPGYRHVTVRPTPVGNLKWALYSTQTDGGTLSVRWDITGNTFRLKVRIPEGSHATIRLPDGSSPIEVGAGNHRCSCTLK